MEGFGIFIAIAYAIYWVSRRLRINSINRDLRNLAKKKGQDYWTDLSGDMITMDTGEPFDYRKLNPDGSASTRIWTGSGDMVKINTLTGRIMENTSETERKEAERKGREWAIKTGNRLYPISTERDEKDCYQNRARFDKDFKGRRYKDIKTGEQYVLRRAGNIFALNIDTGKFDGVLTRTDHDYVYAVWQDSERYEKRVGTLQNCKAALQFANEERESSVRMENERKGHIPEIRQRYYCNDCAFDNWYDINYFEQGYKLAYMDDVRNEIN